MKQVEYIRPDDVVLTINATPEAVKYVAELGWVRKNKPGPKPKIDKPSEPKGMNDE